MITAATRRLLTVCHLPWRMTLGLMILAVSLSAMVQLLPWAGGRPLAVHLLPAFWVAFIAVYLQGPVLGLLTALAVPLAGYCTGNDGTGSSVWELIVFVLVASLLVHRWPVLRFGAPLAWVLAKAAVLLVAFLYPPFTGEGASAAEWVASVRVALPGVGLLLVLNAMLVALLPKDRDWDSL